MGNAPTDEELRAFVHAMLSNLDGRLREPEVIDEALRAHREMWVTLYRAGVGSDMHEVAPARRRHGK